MVKELSFKGHNVCEVFRFRIGQWDYCNISFDETTGAFSINSSFGDFTHSWPSKSARGDVSLREFILGCDEHYLMNKFSYDRHAEFHVFDEEKTREKVIRHLLRLRLLNDISKDDAREVYDGLCDADWSNTDSVMRDLSSKTYDTISDIHEYIVYDYTTNQKFVRDELIPMIRKWFKENAGRLTGW